MAALDLLAEAQDFDSLHLQEMAPPGVWGDDAEGRLGEWRGHTLLWAEHTATALVVHRRWASRIRGSSIARRMCGAAIGSDDEGTLIVISVHAPMSWEHDSEWFDFLVELHTQIAVLSALGNGGRV